MTGGIGRIRAEQFWTEQVRLTPLTSDPTDSEEGELWLRADLAEEDDQLATLRLDTGGSTVDIPVFDVGADVPDGIETQLRLVVDGQQGFVPTTPDDPAIEQFGVWSGGVRYGVADALSAIPDSAIYRWKFDEEDGSTVGDSIGDKEGTIDGATWLDDEDYVGGHALVFDADDEDKVTFDTLPELNTISGQYTYVATVDLDDVDTTQVIWNHTGDDDIRLTLLVNDGELGAIWRDADGNDRAGAEKSIDTGRRRVGVAFDFDEETAEVSVDTDTSASGMPSSFVSSPDVHRISGRSGDTEMLDATVDHPILYDELFGDDEWQDDFDAQPWI